MMSIRDLAVRVGLRDEATRKLEELDRRSDRLVGSLKRHSRAMMAVGAASAGLIGIFTKGAVEEEKFRMNIKSLTGVIDAYGEGANKVNKELQGFIDQSTKLDYVSKRQRAGMVSTLALFGAEKTTIMNLVPVLERYGIATGRTSEQVLQAIQSAAGGQYRSLKYLGITLEEEDVKGKIKEMGSAWDYMGEEQKRMAAITELVIPKMNKQIGNFDDATNNSWAQLQRLRVQLDDLTGNIGGMFLPMLNKGTSALIRITKALDDKPWAKTGIAVSLLSGAALGLVGLLVGPVHSGLKTAGGLLRVLGVQSTIATIRTRGFTAALKANRVAMIAYATATKAATLATKLLNLAFRRTPIGLLLTGVLALGAASKKVFGSPMLETLRKGIGAGIEWLLDMVQRLMAFLSSVYEKISPLLGIGKFLMPGLGAAGLASDIGKKFGPEAVPHAVPVGGGASTTKVISAPISIDMSGLVVDSRRRLKETAFEFEMRVEKALENIISKQFTEM